MASLPPENEPLAYEPARPVPISGMAVTSMILGLIATPLDIVFFAGALFGIAACILGAISVGRINRGGQRGKAFAIAGIILGTVSLLVAMGCGILLFNSNI